MHPFWNFEKHRVRPDIQLSGSHPCTDCTHYTKHWFPRNYSYLTGAFIMQVQLCPSKLHIILWYFQSRFVTRDVETKLNSPGNCKWPRETWYQSYLFWKHWIVERSRVSLQNKLWTSPWAKLKKMLYWPLWAPATKVRQNLSIVAKNENSTEQLYIFMLITCLIAVNWIRLIFRAGFLKPALILVQRFFWT